VLAAKLRRPYAIIAGILVATPPSKLSLELVELTGLVGDRLGIAVEFVDETPRQERLREFDAGRIHVCSMCGLPYVWLISCRLTPSFVPSGSSSSATFSASSRAEATLDIGHRRLQSRLQALRHQCATRPWESIASQVPVSLVHA